jgi:hypothetical protein
VRGRLAPLLRGLAGPPCNIPRGSVYREVALAEAGLTPRVSTPADCPPVCRRAPREVSSNSGRPRRAGPSAPRCGWFPPPPAVACRSGTAATLPSDHVPCRRADGAARPIPTKPEPSAGRGGRDDRMKFSLCYPFRNDPRAPRRAPTIAAWMLESPARRDGSWARRRGTGARAGEWERPPPGGPKSRNPFENRRRGGSPCWSPRPSQWGAPRGLASELLGSGVSLYGLGAVFRDTGPDPGPDDRVQDEWKRTPRPRCPPTPSLLPRLSPRKLPPSIPHGERFPVGPPGGPATAPPVRPDSSGRHPA